MKAPIHTVRLFATKVLLSCKSQAAKMGIEAPADFPDAADSLIELQINEEPVKD